MPGSEAKDGMAAGATSAGAKNTASAGPPKDRTSTTGRNDDEGRRPRQTVGSPSLRRLRRVGEACLWLLVIGVTIYVVAQVAARLRLVVLPILLALVLATLLEPPTDWLRRHSWPSALAALVVVLGALLLIGGPLVAITPLAIEEFGELDVGISGGLEQIQQWLAQGPLGLSDTVINQNLDQLQQQVSSNVDSLTQRALTGAALVLEVLAGLVLSIVLLFFFLKDGHRIWNWLCGLAPPQRRDDVRGAGRRSWAALAGFLRAQTVVALFDAVFIGLALLLIGVPLVLPLVVLTFFGAYIPILGATIAGLAAALVALFSEGPLAAVLVVAAILVVQQVEGNVLQPFIVGRQVDVHPVAVLLAVTAGGVLAGIIGAMVAAPVLALTNAVLSYTREHLEPAPAPAEAEAEARAGPA